MALKKAKREVPTIDVVLVTLTPSTGDELAIDTANKIEVEPQTDTVDAVKLIIKGRLISQKGKQVTVTGNLITLTDNIFGFELAKILNGGTITYDEDLVTPIGYAPPVVGDTSGGEVFTLNAYSAIYDTAGLITGYEKISYPNCKGDPFGLSSEDGTFRVQEYTINSAPSNGQAPFTLSIIEELPAITA